MEIIHTDYQVRYDPATATVSCHGSFRLAGEEYKPILDLMLQAADAAPPLLTLDVRDLQFLNSSGINTLSKLILHVRKQNASLVRVLGSKQFPWQEKSLINLQRLLPSLKLEIA
jgi:hypothetical protein